MVSTIRIAWSTRSPRWTSAGSVGLDRGHKCNSCNDDNQNGKANSFHHMAFFEQGVEASSTRCLNESATAVQCEKSSISPCLCKLP